MAPESRPAGEHKLAPKLLPLPELRSHGSVLKPAPGSADEIFQRGSARLNQGDFIGAIEDLSSVIAIDPSHRDAYALRATAGFQLSDFTAAIRDYTQAIEFRPTTIAYFNRGLARRQEGDAGGARADLRQAPDEVLAAAKKCMEGREYEEALEYLGLVLEADPKRRDASVMRGRAAHNLQRFDDAVRDYSRALELAPDPVTFFNRGAARAAQRRFQDAVADYDEAIKLRATDKDYYWSRGLAKEELGDAPGALADFTRSLGGPSEAKKEEIAAKLQDEILWSGRYATLGCAVWLAFILLGAFDARYVILSLWIGPITVGGLFGGAINGWSRSRGRGNYTARNALVLIPGFGILGPLLYFPVRRSLSAQDKACQFCETVAPPHSVACRRCGAPQ